MKITPSQSPFPVFALCPPTYVDTVIANNAWMTDLSPKELATDKPKFMGQWYNFYNVLAANALVHLLPPKQGLQDQTYVNSAAYLPHYKKKDTIILSNFTAKGRAGEEEVAGKFFRDLGYDVVKCPYKFEGEPELKYIRDNIYLGGHGIRTDIKALKWIEEKFGAKIIPIKEIDPYLYHLDCSIFPLNKYNVVAYTDYMNKNTIKAIEKVVTIHPVSEVAAYQGACNSVRVGNFVFNASSLSFMKRTDKYYEEERKKNIELEDICEKSGYELMYFNFSEAMKGGALLSCFCMHLNYRDTEF